MIQLGKSIMPRMTFLSQVLPSVGNVGTITGFCKESQYCDISIWTCSCVVYITSTYESPLIQQFITIQRWVTRLYVSTTIWSSSGKIKYIK